MTIALGYTDYCLGIYQLVYDFVENNSTCHQNTGPGIKPVNCEFCNEIVPCFCNSKLSPNLGSWTPKYKQVNCNLQ